MPPRSNPGRAASMTPFVAPPAHAPAHAPAHPPRATNGLLPPPRPRRSLRAAVDPLHGALALLMVMSISRVHQQFGFIAVARPAILLVGACLFYAIMNPRYLSEKGLLFTWPPKLIGGFAMMACLSVPFGISPGASGLFILKLYVPVLVFAALLIVGIRRTSDLYAFVWSFVIGAGVLAFFANYVFKLTVASGTGMARLSDMYMYDANDAGLVLTLSIPLTLLTLQVSRWPGKLLSLLFLFWEWTAIARTGSRGAFVGVLVVGLGLLFLSTGISVIKRVGILFGAALVLLVAAPPGYWKQMQSLTKPTDDYNWTSKDGRKQVAKRGIKYMLDFPVAGVGISNFARAEGTISDKAKNWTQGEAGIRWSAPHNSHIEAGAELGIPGLLLWSAMLIGGIVAPIRLRRRLPRAWRRGSPEERFIFLATSYLPVSMLGFVVCSTFVSFAWLDPLYVLLSFISGLYVCVDVMLPKRAPTRPAMAGVRPVAPAGRFG